MGRQMWTDLEVQVLRESRSVPTSALAEMLNRSEQSIHCKRKKTGLTYRHLCRVCGDFCHPKGWTCKKHRRFFEAFKNTREGAKKRGYSFTLTHKDFLQVWMKPCIYCGDEPEQYGIDRVDNSRGYEPDNIVPCCLSCNKAKSKHTTEEWMARMERILDRARWRNPVVVSSGA